MLSTYITGYLCHDDSSTSLYYYETTTLPTQVFTIPLHHLHLHRLMANVKYTSSRLSGSDSRSKQSKSGPAAKKGTKKLGDLADIEAALLQLEVKDSQDDSKPASSCNCSGRKHPLNTVTPNCLNCGFILCLKNPSTQCPYCKEKLLSTEELEAIKTVLSQERAALVNSASISSNNKNSKLDSAQALDKANLNLNRLLGYQATSAQRTQIIDHASDYDAGAAVNPWANATEQAAQLKRQQRLLKEQKKRNDRLQGRGSSVLSIDLKGNKVVLNTSKNYDYDDDAESDEDLVSGTSTPEPGPSSTEPSTGKVDQKKLISPSYTNTSTLAQSKIIDQPNRLQTAADDSYLEL